MTPLETADDLKLRIRSAAFALLGRRDELVAILRATSEELLQTEAEIVRVEAMISRLGLPVPEELIIKTGAEDPPVSIFDRVVEVLSSVGKPLSKQGIAQRLNMIGNQGPLATLDRWVSEGRLTRDVEKRYGLPQGDTNANETAGRATDRDLLCACLGADGSAPN
jgi:hypothetical protein